MIPKLMYLAAEIHEMLINTGAVTYADITVRDSSFFYTELDVESDFDICVVRANNSLDRPVMRIDREVASLFDVILTGTCKLSFTLDKEKTKASKYNDYYEIIEDEA